MARREHKVRKLSKGLLEMKFMKRSKEKAEKEKEAEDTQALFTLSAEMKKGRGYQLESSYVPCEDLIVGRLSFHGMNPEVELLMKREEEKQNVMHAPKQEAEVSDEEMAYRYSTLMDTTAKKFKTKRQNSGHDSESETKKKKFKFIKPAD